MSRALPRSVPDRVLELTQDLTRDLLARGFAEPELLERGARREVRILMIAIRRKPRIVYRRFQIANASKI